jgi:hypothetical protein
MTELCFTLQYTKIQLKRGQMPYMSFSTVKAKAK